MKPFDSINACRYLYLQEIGEPSDNVLRLVVAQAVLSGPISDESLAVHPPELRQLLSDSREIAHEPGCKVFELVWPSYIGYSVRNESYALPEPESAVGEGKLFVEYSSSRYLDSVASSTVASENYPGPYVHWALYCLNHTVDVASTEAPAIDVTIRR